MYIGVNCLKFRILYISLSILLFSCVTTEEIPLETENISKDIEIEIPPILQQEPTKEELDEELVQNYLQNMTLEEKIGQLFIFQIRGYTEVDDNLKKFLSLYKPGGVILFANNIINNNQVLKLNNDLQKISSIPMFIGVDEEGGIVSRLGRAKNVDVTHLPPALTIGNKNNTVLAYNSGKVLGSELNALGFNMDMAPVADVNTNPNNPVIGNRTYSADQHIAAEMVVNVINGLQEENIISVIKHFPGHGDTETDTHNGTVVSPHNRDRLDQIEFVPFKKGIEAGVDVIMTAHMNMPGISSTPLPATLNPEIITGILREDLGFKGIIITDALDMGAISNNFTSGEAVILGIKAGIDILLIPFNQKTAFDRLLESAKTEIISISRIDESVLRILRLKLKYGILDNSRAITDIIEIKNDPKHKLLIDSLINQ